MTTRAARLLHLLDDLHRRRKPVPGARLADLLGISLRTLYRDIETLRGQGADIVGDPGVGYQLRPGFMLPPMMFSAEELEAVALGARWVAAHGDPELATAARSAMDRISSALPEAPRLQVETGGLFAPDWRPVAQEPWLPTLRLAIREEHAVRMQYADAEGRASERVIWPFAMAFLPDMRLLAAWCELRGDFRHFRADRVLAMDDTGVRYPERRHRLLKRWREPDRQRVAAGFAAGRGRGALIPAAIEGRPLAQAVAGPSMRLPQSSTAPCCRRRSISLRQDGTSGSASAGSSNAGSSTRPYSRAASRASDQSGCGRSMQAR